MSNEANATRRSFLKSAAAAGLPTVLGSHAFAQKEEKSFPYEFCTFTKPLQHLSYDEVSQIMVDAGFDGVESPIRTGGHIEPEAVADELPKMMESLKKHDLKLTLLTSSINEVSEEQFTESVLREAAAQGVKRFRMAYYKYDLDKPIRPQLDEFRAKLKDLIALTDEIGIKPIYQNHSGKNYFGAPVWDMVEVFSDFDPKQIGIAFDIGHATVEGAKAWPLHFATARPYIDTIYVKEPSWDDNTLDWGPIGKGVVDKGFYELLKKSEFNGPLSLHVEYLPHKDPKMTPKIIQAIKDDFVTLKSFLA